MSEPSEVELRVYRWLRDNPGPFTGLIQEEKEEEEPMMSSTTETETADVKVGYVAVPQMDWTLAVKPGYILATLPDGQIIKAIAENSRGAEALITELLDRNYELWAYEGMLPVGLVDIREAPEEFEINQEFIELMQLTMDEMDERARDEGPYDEIEAQYEAHLELLAEQQEDHERWGA